jgi:hypothetical protein
MTGPWGPPLLGQQVDEALDRVQLALGLRVEPRREDRRRGVPPSSVNSSWSRAESRPSAGAGWIAIAPIGRSCTRSGTPRSAGQVVASARRPSRRSRRRHRPAHHALAERWIGKSRSTAPSRPPARARWSLVEHVDREHLGADQVDHDLDDDLAAPPRDRASSGAGSSPRTDWRGCCSPPRSRCSARRTGGSRPRRSQALEHRRCARPPGSRSAPAAPRRSFSHSARGVRRRLLRLHPRMSSRRRRSFSRSSSRVNSAPLLEETEDLLRSKSPSRLLAHASAPFEPRAAPARRPARPPSTPDSMAVGDLVQRQHDVDRPGTDRLLRHAEDHRRLLGFRHHPAPGLPDAAPARPSSPMPVSTIASRSRPPKCLAAEANSRSTEGAYLSRPGAPRRVTVRPPRRSNSRCEPPGATSTLPGAGSRRPRPPGPRRA